MSEGKLFYGWVVVAAAFVVTFVGLGTIYTFGSFASSLQAAFGASRGSVSTIFGATGFVYFMASALTGPLADRLGVRPLAATGMLLLGAGAIGAGLATTLSGVLAAYVLGIGLGFGCAYVPAVAAVQRWFAAKRGLASGLAVSGIGFGTLLLPPLAAASIAAWGWRATYVGLGIGAAVLGVGAALLLRDDPADLGLYPDGAARPPSTGVKRGITLGAAIRSAAFLVLFLASLATGIGAFVPFAHIVPYAVDHGVAPLRAPLLIAVIGVGSLAARVLFGRLADRWGRGTSVLAMTLGVAAVLAVWPTLAGFWALATFALLFGLFYGGWSALFPALVMDWFGARHLAGIMGILYAGIGIGNLIGPSAVGIVFDMTHSYATPLLASAAAALLGAGGLAAAGRLRGDAET